TQGHGGGFAEPAAGGARDGPVAAQHAWKASSPLLDWPALTPRIEVCAGLDTRSWPCSCLPVCSGQAVRAATVSTRSGSIGGVPSRSWRSLSGSRLRGCSLAAPARPLEVANREARVREVVIGRYGCSGPRTTSRTCPVRHGTTERAKLNLVPAAMPEEGLEPPTRGL